MKQTAMKETLNNTMDASYFDTKNNETIEIQTLVKKCSQVLSPVWPIETFIACNPLRGFESMPFEKAIHQAQALAQAPKNKKNLANVNRQLIKWCEAYFDIGQSTLAIPYKEKRFYTCFLKLAIFDDELHQHKQSIKDWLSSLPESPESAIQYCLNELGVTKDQEESFVRQSLYFLPGWAGYIQYLSEWKTVSPMEAKSTALVDFLAVRLIMTAILWPNAVKDITLSETKTMALNIKKLVQNEENFKHTLLSHILPTLEKPSLPKTRADVQMVFCIDVRSEPFRRAIEAQGPYETLGFAGFFGLPIQITRYHDHQKIDACPVLLKPRFSVIEQPKASEMVRIQHFLSGKKHIAQLQKTYQQLKYNVATPFALAEALGLWCGLLMLFRSLSPQFFKRFTQRIKSLICPAIQTEPNDEAATNHSKNGMSHKDQLNYAEAALRLMGLTSNFAKMIVFCGHGSTTENNPYASALDCGACGGNPGGTNAQLLASILNHASIRTALEDRGIHIPLDTVFYGALHNTTTDMVTLYETNRPAIYPTMFQQFKKNLLKAQQMTVLERQQKLNADGFQAVLQKSIDWSETRPEWGLAKNAAFIIGPRWLTQSIHLDGRCFLHSYQWQQDTDGSLLETILTAPMIVAEWINTQYLFSTLDNTAYGSGSKITHNVVGKLGVKQGNGSDLMHGLPLQSVNSDDQTPYHHPQRLLTVVYGDKHIVKQLIEKHALLKTLFLNQWVHLIVIDPIEHHAYQFNQQGQWTLYGE